MLSDQLLFSTELACFHRCLSQWDKEASPDDAWVCSHHFVHSVSSSHAWHGLAAKGLAVPVRG